MIRCSHMSITRAIAHNTIIQIAGKIISVFLGLVALGMMTRYLGHEQFGWYITTVSFLQFVGILIDFGLIPVTAQMLAEDKARADDEADMYCSPFIKGELPATNRSEVRGSILLKNLLGFRLVTAIIFLGLAPLIALFFPYPREVKIAIGFSTLSFLGTAMNQVLVGFYQTKLKMYLQVIGENIGRIVLVLGLWLLISQKASFLPIMIVIMLSSVSYTAFLWIAAYKETDAGLAFDMTEWKRIMRKMWPVAISIVFNVIYLKGDTIILSLFRSQAEVGVYGAAYRVIDILAQTAMMLMGVILPVLAFNWSRNLVDVFRKHYQQAFDAMMLLAVPMTVGTIMLADRAMTLVAGKDFAISAKPLQILALAVFGVYLGAVFGHTAVAINRQKETMWIYISDAILTLIGYFIFVPKFGMYGAAWMSVFSELYAGILLWLTIQHYSKESIKLATFGKIILASILMAATLYTFDQLHVVLLVAIGIAVYGAMLLAFGAISKETVKEILMRG